MTLFTFYIYTCMYFIDATGLSGPLPHNRAVHHYDSPLVGHDHFFATILSGRPLRVYIIYSAHERLVQRQMAVQFRWAVIEL